jgi:hypothetical protein
LKPDNFIVDNDHVLLSYYGEAKVIDDVRAQFAFAG